MTGQREPRADDRPESATDEQPDPAPEDESTHLDDVEDGAGCTEIWEHLSERREAERDA
ncbi:hypothetical protein U4E84_10905 [Halorubrum sp. AD140]|uniref:hypothetical protein n=1 Tax=Halorubrum sp. AD140 TaxID=3050073 RepID=UPI002ACC48AE|nr:hypothetical protein [Halorubrum sp. AD140]MDZ5811849.1 hypothetical protein [Halorubrum sp. AD140]